MHMRNRWVSTMVLAIVAAAALVVTGCGSSDSSSSSSSSTTASASTTANASTTSGATSGPKLTVAIPVVDPAFGVAYVAQARGDFQKEGVDVDVQGGVGANSMPLLVSGKADMALIGSGTGILPNLQGKHTSVIYNFAGGGFGGMVVIQSADASKFTSLKDLDGQRVGVLGGGEALGDAALYAKKSGVKFDIVPFNDTASLAAALESGSIKAAVGVKSWFDSGLTKGSLKILVDTADPAVRKNLVGGYHADNSVVGVSDNLQSKKESVVKFLKALNDANEYLHTASSAEIAKTLAKLPSFKGLTNDFLVKNLDYGRNFLTPTNGTVSPALWAASLQEFANWGLRGFSASDPKLGYANAVDMSYLNQALAEQKK